MRLDRLDLNLLVVFEAIYAEGNLTRAAARLNVAQPTVSNALARLRLVYDDPLFVRSGRGVTPTPVARQMIAPLRQALRQLQTTLERKVQFDPATAERTFIVSVGEVAGSLVLPALVEQLERLAPLCVCRPCSWIAGKSKTRWRPGPWTWRSTSRNWPRAR